MPTSGPTVQGPCPVTDRTAMSQKTLRSLRTLRSDSPQRRRSQQAYPMWPSPIDQAGARVLISDSQGKLPSSPLSRPKWPYAAVG